MSNTIGLDFEISQLICDIEEKHSHEVHMVIEPIYKKEDTNGDPSWWVEFKDTNKVLNTLEDVRKFFLEECEA